MQSQGIDSVTLQTLQALAPLPFVQEYYLAGGTACALHLGHRISYDLDFFSSTPALPLEIREGLLAVGNLEIDQNDVGTFNGRVNETKISFFVYSYPLMQPPTVFEGVQVASLDDLICMKLEAVSSRGVRRDFVDLYYLLQYIPLPSALNLFDQKFAQQNVSATHVLKSLVYFADADIDPDPHMLVKYNWDEIKRFFIDQVQKLVAKDSLQP